jgi:hypothetical protein
MTDEALRPAMPPSGHSTAGDPRTPGRTRRWIIALVTTIAMLVATSGVAVFAQAGAALAGPDYLPSGSLAYAELRLDLPGDQHDQLAAFMAHFPGFSDPATFDLKLNEALDRALGTDPDGDAVYATYIRPWFDGRASIGVPPLDAPALEPGHAPPIVVALGVADRSALETIIADLRESMGPDITWTEIDHDGVTVVTLGGDSQPFSYAITDRYLLLSPDAALLGSSLDALSGAAPSLADDAAYRDAVGTHPVDHLGLFYIDTAGLLDLLTPMLLAQMGGDASQAAMLDQVQALLDTLPVTISGTARVDADHVTAEIQARPGEGTPALSVRATDLAARMPPDTLFYMEIRDLGATVGTAIADTRPTIVERMGEDALQDAQTFLGAPVEDYLDFVEDAALGVSLGARGLNAGVVASLNDPATAQERVTSLLGFVRAVAAQADSGVTVSASQVEGTTVTTISVDPKVANLPPNLPIVPSVSVAVTDSQLLIGLGDFAADALERAPEDSLAAAPRYVEALDAAGGPANAGVTWLDLAGVVKLVSLSAGRSMGSHYATDIAPWLEPLDVFIGAANQTVDGVLSSRAILFVK